MAKQFDDMLRKLQKDADENPAAAELLSAFMEKCASLGKNPSEDELERVFQECLIEQLSGAFSSTDTDLSENSEGIKDYMESTCRQVREVFDQEGWHYGEVLSRSDYVVYEMGFGLRNCRVRMRAGIEANPKVCRIDAILPISADNIYEYILCQIIARENYPKRFGALQYDANDGEISYRYSYPIQNGFYKDDFKQLFLTVATSADSCYEIIKNACVGKFRGKEITEILTKVNDLVSDLSEYEE